MRADPPIRPLVPEPFQQDWAGFSLADRTTHPVWVLLGRRTGDNSQLVAAAEALGLPYRTLQLRFRSGPRLNVLLGASLRGLLNPEIIPEESPRLVLSVGRLSPPVARWIRERSGGTTRLVHFGRPWAPASWFDLIVTTPQYQLQQRGNVLCNLLPFLRRRPPSAIPSALASRIATFPRPWTVVLAGGHSRPYVFDEAAARAVADRCNAITARDGGSLFFLPSPRTPEACVRTIGSRLLPPSYTYLPERDENPYGALLLAADRFVVTSDSAMMVAETLVTGRPVEIFPLPRRPDLRYRAVAIWEWAAAHSRAIRSLYRKLHDLALLQSTRELPEYYRRLREAGAFTDARRCAALARREREASVTRILTLLRGSP